MGILQIGKIQVDVSEAAYEAVSCSGQQGAIFPQALAEVFEEADLDVKITMDAIQKKEVFPGALSDEMLLKTIIEPLDPVIFENAKDVLVQYTNLADLAEPRTTKRLGFHAVNTAREFVRSYRQYYAVQ